MMRLRTPCTGAWPSLPKGEKGTVELVAMPTEAGPQTLQVDGHAQQGLADHKQRDITVEGLAAIMFEVKDTEDPIEVNGETGYEIRVVNQGTKAATNVQVAVDIPPGLKVISAEGESNHKLQDGRLIFEPLQQLGSEGRYGVSYSRPRFATGRPTNRRDGEHRRPRTSDPARRKHARVWRSIKRAVRKSPSITSSISPRRCVSTHSASTGGL